jgi:spore coat polysaccharide biosynthesis protein SpsF
MIGAIIAARMGSSRLPGKVMMTLGGKTMLERTIDATLKSKVECVVVLTTSKEEDDPIRKRCAELGVSYVDGSNNRDLLGDFYTAATQYGFDPVVRVTADCPLLSPYVINSVINEYYNGCAYCSNIVNRTYPRGLDVEVFSYGALEWLHHSITRNNRVVENYHDDYRKHVTLYIREHSERFKTRYVEFNPSKLRLTVDTQDEYDKLAVVFDLLGDDATWFTAMGVVSQFPEFASFETEDSQTTALGKVW